MIPLRLRHLPSLVALLVLCAFVVFSGHAGVSKAQQPEAGNVVIPVSIFVRSGPGQQFPAVGALFQGDTVRPLNLSEDGQWVLILYRRQYGWIQRSLVRWTDEAALNALPVLPADITPTPLFAPTVTPFIPTATPTGSYVLLTDAAAAFVRAGPGRGYLRLGDLRPGTVVEPVARNESTTWIMIRFANPIADFEGFGWIQRNLVRWSAEVDLEALPIVFETALTPSPTFTASPTSTATTTPSATPTPSLTPTATPSPTSSNTPTSTPLATHTPSSTPTNTASPTPSNTPTSTPSATHTPSSTPTNTASPTPSNTPTSTPSATHTPSSTPTNTASPTPSNTPTFTPSATHTPSSTPTNTASPTPSNTPMVVEAVVIATSTPTHTATASATRTQTPSPTATPSQTPTATATVTPSATPTASSTPTASPTSTHTATVTATASLTLTPSATLTNTPIVAAIPASPTPPPSAPTTPTNNVPPFSLEVFLSMGGLLLLAGYGLFYWRGATYAQQYSNGFVIDRCPVCHRGHLTVETRTDRMLGVPLARHVVRCDQCRSLLRAVGSRRWRYAVDRIENIRFYEQYNGKILTEDELRQLRTEPHVTLPTFEDDTPSS